MKTAITRAPATRSPRATWSATIGLALALTCLFATPPLQAASPHRGGQQHSQAREHNARSQEYRHVVRRRGNDYGSNEGYAYGAPPILYAPEAAPGVSLFLPL